MEESTKKKLKAAGKIGMGAFNITSGALTMVGHGLTYTMAKGAGVNKHALARYASNKVKDGWKGFQEGFDDWNKP